MNVERVIFHEFRYKPRNHSVPDWDVALLRLDEEIDITIYTPVCLPVLGEDYVSPDEKGNWQPGTALGK